MLQIMGLVSYQYLHDLQYQLSASKLVYVGHPAIWREIAFGSEQSAPPLEAGLVGVCPVERGNVLPKYEHFAILHPKKMKKLGVITKNQLQTAGSSTLTFTNVIL